MKNRRQNLFQLLLIVAYQWALIVNLAPSVSAQNKPDDRTRIAGEMEKSIRTEILNLWYPPCVDKEFGGFLSTLTYNFKPTGSQDKMIVTQARHTWTTAKAAERYPALTYYKDNARHGFLFLRDVMLDKQYGGFYTLVDRQGQVKSEGKEVYGNAFGLYALSAYYHMSHDTAALNLAKRSFGWLEKHSHDPMHKGYFYTMRRDGTPVKRDATVPSTDRRGL